MDDLVLGWLSVTLLARLNQHAGKARNRDTAEDKTQRFGADGMVDRFSEHGRNS